MNEQFDRLIEVGKLSGRIETLRDLKAWLDAKLIAAEAENERQAKEAHERIRTASTTTN